MTSRFVRVLLVLLALLATLGLAYRAVQDEIAAARADDRIAEVERLADAALTRIADLRAALYAYVAAGQGADFWIGHAGALLDGLGTNVRELNEAVALTSVSVERPAKDYMALLTAAEARARRFVQSDQPRLASDVIFNDARDALDMARLHAAGTRETAIATSRAGHLILQRQRVILAAGALFVWLAVALLLVPTGKPRAMPLPIPVPAAAPVEVLAAPTPIPATRPDPRPALKPVPVRVGPDVAAAAVLCGDLARAASVEELQGLLERAARVLHATGVIVWMANTEALYPAASWGYDERVLARVSSIPRDAANLTAAALRTGTIRTTAAGNGAAAALAAPLVGPAGPVGVLSGELNGVTDVGENTAAVAAILAAQLVTLIGSMPPNDTAAPAQQANA